MSILEETETCGASRETIRKFLQMPKPLRDHMTDDEKTKLTLAFYHVEGCVQRHGMPELCNKLLEELRAMTWEKDKNGDKDAKYDPDVVKYLFFAKFPMHNTPGTEDNPLKNLAW